MSGQTKIVIAGIGGVGGYFGGLLARCYAGNDDIQVYFIARGEHLEQIKKNGLEVIKGEVAFFAKPYRATNNANSIGIVDYVIICTKNYDLKEILNEIQPCVGNHTVILPLQNGVNAVECIKSRYPENVVPSGCAYIVSTINKPGVVENSGSRQEIYFGIADSHHPQLNRLEALMKYAGIEVTLSDQINKLVWEKFIFLSSIATATSYYKESVGKLLEHYLPQLKLLLKEATSIAMAKNIKVDKNIIKKALDHYYAMPYGATSSLQRDFLAQKSETELDHITGYIMNEGEKLGIKTPNFDRAYAILSQS